MSTLSVGSLLLCVYLVAIATFSIAPVLVVIGASLTSGELVEFPPRGLSLRWYESVAANGVILDAFKNSLVVATATAVVSTALAFLAAYPLTRYDWRMRAAIELLLQSPLLLPSIVIGLALARFFIVVGLFTNELQLLLAHVILTFPYGLRGTMASLRGMDRSLEEAAAILGAGPVRRFWRILLPLAKPGLVAGALFVFVTSFDNVTVSLWLVSPSLNLFPLWLFSYIEANSSALPAAAASASVFVTVTAAILLDQAVGIRRYLGTAG